MNFSMPTMKKLVMVTFAVAALSSTTMLPTTLHATTTATPTTVDASAYKAKCASCHGMDGNANTAKGKEMKVRAFSSAEVKGMSDQKLLDVILKGKGKMQGYEKSLGKEKCQALVAYCRSLGK